ncbi:nucleotidyltransferase family protein [Novosphingobium sp. Fuku2-ISO-50]|uniref:nucleotidyltransferase family protein n=1 Tax=Novosphingobium sp. Fuku2-ISO-50 TaxID=1739114 RepID=UPI00076CC480|nr:nucleotidyltransferase family protein [Novosphingobium sp. Fuku2-ISO-50]KUR79645.1 mannose-1-phosphate guanylyltransferase [Novosphingobium sp. Fuku2-ISO-50]
MTDTPRPLPRRTAPLPGGPLASDVAMLLSAGMGKRMRPLTATRPKPLVRVVGKPLIDYSLDKLVEAGVSRAVVNVHYLSDQLVAHLKGRKAPSIAISDETDGLLETGGGMVRAAPLIAADPFFCLNTDAIWLDGPRNAFAALSEAWDAARMDALLLLVSHAQAYNYTGMGDFHLDPLGRISRRKPGRVAPYIFTGIQIVSQRLLRDAPDGAFSTGVLWDRAMAEGRLYGLSHTGLWFEVGSPAMIAPTEAALTGA